MMRFCLSLVALLLAVLSALAQPPCQCPPLKDSSEASAETTFVFKNGETVILCGSEDVDTKGSTFSAFALRHCGQDSVLGFWNENKTCRVSLFRDTLSIENLLNLPVGRENSYIPVPLIIDKVFFANTGLKRLTRVNAKFRKLNRSECDAVVRNYEITPKPIVDNLEDIIN
jgi:hypothetical protein